MCRACQEAVGPNLEAFEECQLYYGFQEDVCINQASLSTAGMADSLGENKPPALGTETTATASSHLEAA